MIQTLRQVWSSPWLRLVVYVLLLIALFQVLGQIQSAITTLVMAFVFSYLTSPIVRWFERRRLPRFIGVIAVYVGLGLLLALASVLLADMVAQLSAFAANLPAILTPFFNWVGGLPEQIGRIQLPPALEQALQQASLSLQTLLEGFTQTLLNALRALLSQGGNVIGFIASVLGGVFQLFTALTISIYLLYDLPKIGQTMLQAVPLPYQPLALEIAGKLDRAVGGYVRGQVLVALCVGTVVGVGLWIVGIPLAASLGFLAFIFNFIPFVGVIISSVPAILLALTQNPPLLKALLTVFVLWIANQLEGNLFGPQIVGKAVNIHPVTAIAAILIFAGLFGIPGALLAVPTVAFIKILFTDYYLNSRFYREG
ncbi:AI-2E family transporter [Calidithermus roseus]|uniref:Sporulation integral membrane protein YtvI n=1 Tax=Calidithermus roseus TaxID=1644118 RepID=A0A399EF50_9DEIN|nr:AI-2E family transporter [Calidithermus roseus]RIH83247.1 sporulation integral membrane protein YtvI [Calidithermus roseus]